MIYLDNAASTEVSFNVKQKLASVLDIYGNPSSQHELGFKAKALIDEANNIISKQLNCKPNELHYTTGATMSNNLAIQGFLKANKNGILITDRLEHMDIIMMAQENRERTVFVENDVEGMIVLDDLKVILEKYVDIPALVSIQMANSETGIMQNMKEISKIVHMYPNTYLHTDATQYIPWYKVDVEKLNIDMLSMSGQKIKCIKGIGLLYIKEETPIAPIILGEQGLIGGTENVLGIACLGEAFKALGDLNKTSEVFAKRTAFINALDFPVITNSKYCLPNNINMKFSGVSSEEFVSLLNEFGVCASAGSACSSYSLEPSHVLMAMGLSKEDANSYVRFTISKNTSYEEIDEAVRIIKTIYNMVRKDR